jgi:Na+/H+ antiporter NhaD/arsenite permease-like protein
MEILIIVVFVLGYMAIAFEHPIKVDKAASALITGVLCWAIFVLGSKAVAPHLTEAFHHFKENFVGNDLLKYFYEERLLHHLSEISNILFFLMGAMTIVELVDAHEGFSVITDRITTNNKVKLMWIIGILTFFFSAVLDNLTTSIVMISLLRKLVKDKESRWLFAGLVVIAANAGGAWSPIGDVTTTMLWIKGQLPNVLNMVEYLILPSFVALLIPLVVLSFTLKGGTIERPNKAEGAEHYMNPTTSGERTVVFILGIAGLLFVPVFKTITHLPPFMGMMLSLGVLWVVTEMLHKSKNKEEKHSLSVIGVLQKIDVSSVLFFLGILLAVSALQEVGHLMVMAAWLDTTIGNIYGINVAIGFLSAIVDNVPLVAAAQGMYEIATPTIIEGATNGAYLQNFTANGSFWQFLAYCAGVGGSSLIIGSAAGVAVMGLEKIDFIWYLKKISWLAVIGYLAGALVFILMHS